MSEQVPSRDHRWALGLCVLLVLLLVGGTIGAWVYGARRQRIAVEVLSGTAVAAPSGVIPSIGTGVVYGYAGSPNRATYDYELGEDISSTGSGPPGPAWLRDWLGIDYLATVRGVEISELDTRSLLALLDLAGLRSLSITGRRGDDSQLIDVAMEALPRSPDLELLRLSGWPITDEQLHVLPRLTRLKILEIENCPRITDATMERISTLAGLKSLKLRDCGQLTDAGLAKLGQLKNLETLAISFDNTGGGALEKLSGLPRLEELEIGCFQVADGLRYLGGFAHLEQLALSGVSDESFSAATAPPQLKKLMLVECQGLGSAGLKRIDLFTNLEVLYFELVPQLDDAAMADVAQLPNLRELVITSQPRGRSMTSEMLVLTDDSLKSLAAATSLRSLALCGCPKLTDAGLGELSKRTDLEQLILRAARPGQFSVEALDHLRNCLSKCGFRYSEASPVAPAGSSP